MAKPPVILVVDDDFHITDQLEALLNVNGYTPVVAADGETALKLAAKEVPALILLDLMLPRMDGYAVLEVLRSIPATQKVPVLIMSSKDVVSDVEKAYNKGATDYLHKPIKTDRLLMKMNKYLNTGGV